MDIKELDFIKENYPKYGPKYCANILNINESAMFARAKRLGIKKIGFDKHPSMQKVDPEQFFNINSKEVAYFLGYFWADGNIRAYPNNKNGMCYRISLEIQAEDAIEITPIMKKIGIWNIQKRKRNSNWKETYNFLLNSKDIYRFLESHGYKTKSQSEPSLILNKIPEHLKPFWWRGYFDGDASFFIKDRIKSIQFSGQFDYGWNELKNLYSSLNIEKVSIFRYIHKNTNHKNSKATIFRTKHIKSMCDFLQKSDLGLERKTKKIKQFYEKYFN